jgi:hypothetical protein
VATFTFSGDPNAPKTDPDELAIFGMSFPFGAPVAVEDAEIAARLRRHSHFTEMLEEGAAKPRRGRPPKVRSDG